jgi:hypothetical protein
MQHENGAGREKTFLLASNKMNPHPNGTKENQNHLKIQNIHAEGKIRHGRGRTSKALSQKMKNNYFPRTSPEYRPHAHT